MTRVAAHTAAGFVVLGTGLFIAAWHSGGQPTERTPRWLPMALALASTTATLVLYFALDSKQNAQIAHVIQAGAESAKSQITIRMESRLRSLVRMATRWETAGRPAQAAWEADAANHLRDFPDMQAIEWIDTTHAIRWISPLAGNEAKLGLNLVTEERRAAAIAQAERERQAAITRTVPLFHGGLGYVVYVPLTVAGKPDGVLGTVFQAEPHFARYLPEGIAPGQSIRVSEGGLTVYQRDASTPPSHPEWVAQERVEMHGTTWELRVWPTPALLTELDDPLPEIVLGAGLLGGVLLAAVCYLAQRASRLARLAARARDAMQRALEEVKTLKGLLPICASCKRIRDDTGYWSQVDTYLHRHTDAKLSHGYCPECAAKAFTEFGLEVPEKVRAQLAERNYE
ncbi:MAG: CHASE domain-containing protein [Chthoniobacter sp.]|nr:CHASE domain-containing protein [Chthoniobacter sp.]